DAAYLRSDALSSLAATVSVGFAPAVAYFIIPLLIYGDVSASIVVSIIAIKVGYQIARDSFNVVLEKVIDDKNAAKYKETAQAVSGVITIDQLLARTHGSYVIIDIKISVDPDITVRKGHDIAAKTKEDLINEHSEVEDVLVHINPYLEN